jgi:hypothetical protein
MEVTVARLVNPAEDTAEDMAALQVHLPRLEVLPRDLAKQLSLQRSQHLKCDLCDVLLKPLMTISLGIKTPFVSEPTWPNFLRWPLKASVLMYPMSWTLNFELHHRKGKNWKIF